MLLHITNDYAGSKVYQNLVESLDRLNVGQIVYTPLKGKAKIGLNVVDFNIPESRIIYSPILNKTTDRIFYRKKISKIFKDIETKIDMTKVKMIHAHTWYSDGGVAYELSKKYGIPYIVAVRNTDVNLFLKFLLHERQYGRQILLNSKKIILISAIYKERLLKHRSLSILREVIRKNTVIIPNGVDPFWIENRVLQRKRLIDSNNIDLLYVGKFDKGKNIVNLVNAVKNLNKMQKQKFRLTLIGGKGKEEAKVLRIIENDKLFNYVGPIHDHKELKYYYERSDFFTMPSKAETFGLVYIEALLQGLPVLYTANEGIDGFYNNSIGEKVANTTVYEIECKLQTLALRNEEFDFDLEEIAANHNWKNIAKKYKDIYSII